MPHDKFGRKIQEGDVVVGQSWRHARQAAHVVQGVNEGSTTCNVNASSVHVPGDVASLNAGECEILLKFDGSKPAAPDENL